MCGIAGIVGRGWDASRLEAMVAVQRHRGPDARGSFRDPTGIAGLGHNRLSIVDLSPAGRQPMASADSRYWIVFNGEIYNYRELRAELADCSFRTRTDTEVILAAYARWGAACLDRFVGMFAFAIWDVQEKRLFAARDRFGVKPFHYHAEPDGTWLFASEVKALHVAGVQAEPDPAAWASYLAHGISDHSERTFWNGVRCLPAGHALEWKDGRARIFCWYNLPDRVAAGWDERSDAEVEAEYRALLEDSVGLRFRADVPVGINLSGGLDSSTLLGLVQAVQGAESDVKAFTFVTGSAEYDELPWVEEMLLRTRHPSVVCRLTPEEVPALAESVQWHEDEPFGGLPSLAYAKLFERARQEGVIVLLDGQGMDEQWAGYDYYRSAADGRPVSTVQGVSGSPLRAECLTPDFRALAEPLVAAQPFPDRLRNLQYRDVRFTKIPRALRFNDRISMRSSTELREPFLDHRLVELSFRQPSGRKIRDGSSKWLLRQLTRHLLPAPLRGAPKRPLQTPQREWLRGPLRGWAMSCVEDALAAFGSAWLDAAAVRAACRRYESELEESSFHLWQWVNLGLVVRAGARRAPAAARAAAAPMIEAE
jgi:asparagine synthase (glutamine-hydrolysing)